MLAALLQARSLVLAAGDDTDHGVEMGMVVVMASRHRNRRRLPQRVRTTRRGPPREPGGPCGDDDPRRPGDPAA
ncbi:hypothetical protein [Streptomyces sp. Ru62]|uniref:hypothetical protein n=1 Tax=Streptomyces sp. Ru62 TaxID=2080745 RepID=UPI0011B039A6|nr:hypothetical protein [Streptomyces sp. Ru62]